MPFGKIGDFSFWQDTKNRQIVPTKRATILFVLFFDFIERCYVSFEGQLDEYGKARTINAFQLMMLTYFATCGGPFGIEE